jgi:tRNA U55 pseudouridine synthase TruB
VLGTGAHLIALRRVEAAGVRIEESIALDVVQAEGGREVALAALIPLERMLIDLPSVALNTDGVAHVRVGRDLGPADATVGFAAAVNAAGGAARRHVRLFDPGGQLVAMAEAAQAPGLLHPAVVLM